MRAVTPRKRPPPVSGNLSPVVLTQQANAFLAAARREFERLGMLEISFPAYFLLGRAVELALKSFLLLRGRTESDLRQLGHDLEGVLEDATGLGLPEVAELASNTEHALLWLNALYWPKDLEYPKTGFKPLPSTEPLIQWTAQLISALQPHLRKWRPAKPGGDHA